MLHICINIYVIVIFYFLFSLYYTYLESKDRHLHCRSMNSLFSQDTKLAGTIMDLFHIL